MLGRSFLLLPLAACALVACASSNPTPIDVQCADAPSAHVPAPPAPNASSIGAPGWFAFDAISFGGVTSASSQTCGWAAHALDLDAQTTGLAAAKAGTTTCVRAATAAPDVLQDGPNGVDDAFARYIAPRLHAVDGCFGDATPDATYTLLLHLDHVPLGDDAHVAGALYLARNLPHAPAFDANDHWPIDPASLLDGASIERPIVAFPNGYVAGGTWVSGVGEAAATLPIFLGPKGNGCLPEKSYEVDLAVDRPMIVARLDGSDGTIAGVVPTSSFAQAAAPALAKYGLCPGNATFDELIADFTNAADLVDDGGDLDDPTKACDGISFGAGFTMKPTGAPTLGQKHELPANGCK